MDIRCERCLTEYELEDDTVSEVGTSVQCTTCGNTFEVRRPPRPAGGLTARPDRPTPQSEWVVETAVGDVHRLGDLSGLHRLIVERKVSRKARVSRPGQPWRVLEQLPELSPFFEVVEQADRARAAAAAAPAPAPAPATATGAPGALRPPMVALPSARGRTPAPVPTLGRTPAPVPVRGDSGPLVARGGSAALPSRRKTPAPVRPQPPRVRNHAALPDLPAPAVESETTVVRLRGGFSRFLVTVGVAGAVAYFGITHLPPVERERMPPLAMPGTTHGSSWTPVPTPAPSPAEANALPATALPSTPPPPAAPPAVPTPTAPAPAPPVPSSAPALPATPPPPPAVSPPTTARAPSGRPSDVPDYAQLVADGYRLQQAGALTRARKLYEMALEQRPDGVEALTGMGYVQLDRNRFDTAISYFRRALAIGFHGPAMFGIGEAYRYAGEASRAVEAYRRFLAEAPQDRDAPIARRQIRALATPRTDSEVPSASSILQEGAR